MAEGDVSVLGLVLSLSLVVVAVALSARESLRLERDIVVAVLRSVVQLLIVAAGLTLVIDEGTPLAWSWLWVTGIVVFAAATTARRAPALPHVFRIALAANATTAIVALGLTFGLGVFPLEGRTLVPVAGMVVGNSMKSCVVVVQLLADQVADKREEIEARLALGLTGPASIHPVVRQALRISISPLIENVRALGIVFLPGAMTGLILAGVDPVDAVLVQLALMYIILGSVAITASSTALLSARELFTGDQRLIRIARSTQDA